MPLVLCLKCGVCVVFCTIIIQQFHTNGWQHSKQTKQIAQRMLKLYTGSQHMWRGNKHTNKWLLGPRCQFILHVICFSLIFKARSNAFLEPTSTEPCKVYSSCKQLELLVGSNSRLTDIHLTSQTRNIAHLHVWKCVKFRIQQFWS